MKINEQTFPNVLIELAYFLKNVIYTILQILEQIFILNTQPISVLVYTDLS